MQKRPDGLSLQVHQRVAQRGQTVRRHVRTMTQTRFQKDCAQRHLGQTRAVVKPHRIDRKRPSSFHLSKSKGPSQGASTTARTTDTHHMPLESRQISPARSCPDLCPGDISGPAKSGCKMKTARQNSNRATHRKIDLFYFSRRCIFTYAENLVWVFRGI